MNKLEAEDELRQRAIGLELSPEHAFHLILRATGDLKEAQRTKEMLELRRLNNEHS